MGKMTYPVIFLGKVSFLLFISREGSFYYRVVGNSAPSGWVFYLLIFMGWFEALWSRIVQVPPCNAIIFQRTHLILLTDRRLYSIPTIPDDPNTLTRQSATTNDDPRDPPLRPHYMDSYPETDQRYDMFMYNLPAYVTLSIFIKAYSNCQYI